MRIDYEPLRDRAVLALAESTGRELSRLEVTSWLTLILADGRLAGAEIKQATKHLPPDALLGEDLAGVKEAADLFGVQRSNFVRDIAARPDFPSPVAELASTRVWRRRDLLEYRSNKLASVDGEHASAKHPLMIRVQNNASAALRPLRVSDDARRWLPEMISRLVRRFQPERIILFGSQATGQAHPDSDVDLLVIVPRLAARKLDTKIAMRAALRGIPLGKDILVATPEEVEQRGAVPGIVLHTALKEGVVLYERQATEATG
jgi:uncharacterized protein